MSHLASSELVRVHHIEKLNKMTKALVMILQIMGISVFCHSEILTLSRRNNLNQTGQCVIFLVSNSTPNPF